MSDLENIQSVPSFGESQLFPLDDEFQFEGFIIPREDDPQFSWRIDPLTPRVDEGPAIVDESDQKETSTVVDPPTEPEPPATPSLLQREYILVRDPFGKKSLLALPQTDFPNRIGKECTLHCTAGVTCPYFECTRQSVVAFTRGKSRHTGKDVLMTRNEVGRNSGELFIMHPLALFLNARGKSTDEPAVAVSLGSTIIPITDCKVTKNYDGAGLRAVIPAIAPEIVNSVPTVELVLQGSRREDPPITVAVHPMKVWLGQNHWFEFHATTRVRSRNESLVLSSANEED